MCCTWAVCSTVKAPTILRCSSLSTWWREDVLYRMVTVVLMLLLLLPLLLLPVSFSPLLLLLVIGTLDEALDTPLHTVRHGEVTLGATHPCEGAVLHDWPNLGSVQPLESINDKEVANST